MNGERGGGGESRLRGGHRSDATGGRPSGGAESQDASGGWEIGLWTWADGPGITWVD
jgi:hypothetical protein